MRWNSRIPHLPFRQWNSVYPLLEFLFVAKHYSISNSKNIGSGKWSTDSMDVVAFYTVLITLNIKEPPAGTHQLLGCTYVHPDFINPWHTCAATVKVLCVSIRLYFCYRVFCYYTQQGGQETTSLIFINYCVWNSWHKVQTLGELHGT